MSGPVRRATSAAAAFSTAPFDGARPTAARLTAGARDAAGGRLIPRRPTVIGATAAAVLLSCALLLGAGCGDASSPEPPANSRDWSTFLDDVKRDFPFQQPEPIIRHFFRDRRGGFFVDVGAAHYRNGNNTYYLEQQLGWSGIAIDALEKWGPEYAEHRPRTKFFAYIVTDHAGTEDPFFHISGDIGSTAIPERADRIKQIAPATEVQEVLVPTITLNDLLDLEGVTRIDLLAMDIEQGEPRALAGFDIQRFAPTLVCIEHLPEVQDAILAYFREHGYRRIDRYLEYDGANWYFTPGQ